MLVMTEIKQTSLFCNQPNAGSEIRDEASNLQVENATLVSLHESLVVVQ
jgi:hypothetical protein